MKIDFNKIIGTIKPMHAVNNVPLAGISDRLFHYVGECGAPYVRLHDTGGAYGMNRYVDIENIFRDFNADENDPESYDFAFTDWLLKNIVNQNVKIFYRLGASIETGQRIKAYRIFPPKDNKKWAVICEKIIAHYNEGWANGYHLGIEYWEIWNEPDNYPDIEDNCMWKGTFSQYLELYNVTARHLKEKYPNLKIGGYASCGFYSLFENGFVGDAHSSERTDYFIECFHKFMEYVAKNNLPLDFFSWHSYSDVAKNIAYEKYVHENLIKYGYENAESILNEWNPEISKRGTLWDSANISEMLLNMQNTTVTMLMYYNGAAVGNFDGMYNPLDKTPFKAYYSFKAFNELYKLKKQAFIENIPDGISAVAATDGIKKAVVLTNLQEKTKFDIETNSKCTFEIYRLNDDKNLEVDGTTENSIEINRFETVLLLTK